MRYKLQEILSKLDKTHVEHLDNYGMMSRLNDETIPVAELEDSEETFQSQLQVLYKELSSPNDEHPLRLILLCYQTVVRNEDRY